MDSVSTTGPGPYGHIAGMLLGQLRCEEEEVRES